MPRTNDEITKAYLALLDAAGLNHWQDKPEFVEAPGSELTYRERIAMEAPRCATT